MYYGWSKKYYLKTKVEEHEKKYHFFINGKSVCGRHNYISSIPSNEGEFATSACNRCEKCEYKSTTDFTYRFVAGD